MTLALVMFGYAVVLACWLPAPLRRVAGTGVSPRLGLAAWLAALASVLACTAVAFWLLARTAIAGWPVFARAVCESATTGACPPAVYRSAAYELGLAVAAVLAGLALSLFGWRYRRSLRRARTRTREHAETARIVGHPVAGGDDAFVLDATRPAVYCVPGRPPTIVLTTAALDVLGPEQLRAVLAHERAHLAGRHHRLLALTRCLAAVAPAVPLFSRAASEVAKLAEMRADDVAARHGTRPALLAALLAMSGNTSRGPASWLAATGGVVAVRARRLDEPPPLARQARHALALTALTLATVLPPVVAVAVL